MTQFARDLLAGMGAGIGVGLISGILTGGFIAAGAIIYSTGTEIDQLSQVTPAERAACDKAVAALLSTDSLVELERSKYLIERLNCSVSR